MKTYKVEYSCLLRAVSDLTIEAEGAEQVLALAKKRLDDAWFDITERYPVVKRIDHICELAESADADKVIKEDVPLDDYMIINKNNPEPLLPIFLGSIEN